MIEGIALNIVATGSMRRGSRYSMGLPDDVWRKITVVWDTTPSLCRVIQYIDRFRKALDHIIEDKGSYMEDYGFPHGN